MSLLFCLDSCSGKDFTRRRQARIDYRAWNVCWRPSIAIRKVRHTGYEGVVIIASSVSRVATAGTSSLWAKLFGMTLERWRVRRKRTSHDGCCCGRCKRFHGAIGSGFLCATSCDIAIDYHFSKMIGSWCDALRGKLNTKDGC